MEPLVRQSAVGWVGLAWADGLVAQRAGPEASLRHVRQALTTSLGLPFKVGGKGPFGAHIFFLARAQGALPPIAL